MTKIQQNEQNFQGNEERGNGVKDLENDSKLNVPFHRIVFSNIRHR